MASKGPHHGKIHQPPRPAPNQGSAAAGQLHARATPASTGHAGAERNGTGGGGDRDGRGRGRIAPNTGFEPAAHQRSIRPALCERYRFFHPPLDGEPRHHGLAVFPHDAAHHRRTPKPKPRERWLWGWN